MARRIASSAAVLVLWWARAALADPQPERAQELFDRARALMKEGDYSAACPLLAESQRLDPGGGTLLNLGICYEHEGRPASAYRELRRALERAQNDGRADRTKTAQKHLDSVVPRMSWLTVRLQAADAAVSRVELDGAVLGTPEGAQPVDPGDHELVIRAENRKPWVTRVVVTEQPQELQVDVPELEPLEAAPLPAHIKEMAPVPSPAPPPVPVQAPIPREPVRWPGYVALGAGAVALSASGFLAWRAASLKSDSNDHFDGTHCLAQSCVDDWNAARSAALAADVTALTGVAAVGFGVFWLVRAEKERPRTDVAGWSLQIGHGGAMLSARSRF